ncbi:hypothetical protein RND81_13G200100 [Saponaria officinalis]|uniref:Uncharacterized protein n=1 Tax=Saponaria officinalis TaxID=3572 RepID=A0AAW1GZX3_SAPOF
MQVIKDQDLRERHIGELQGLVFRELRTLNRKAYDALSSQELDDELPVCTAYRSYSFFRTAILVVVTHGVVIETLCKRALPEGKFDGIANASIGVIELSEEDDWFIKSWNDVGHLRGTPLLKAKVFDIDNSP